MYTDIDILLRITSVYTALPKGERFAQRKSQPSESSLRNMLTCVPFFAGASTSQAPCPCLGPLPPCENTDKYPKILASNRLLVPHASRGVSQRVRRQTHAGECGRGLRQQRCRCVSPRRIVHGLPSARFCKQTRNSRNRRRHKPSSPFPLPFLLGPFHHSFLVTSLPLFSFVHPTPPVAYNAHTRGINIEFSFTNPNEIFLSGPRVSLAAEWESRCASRPATHGAPRQLRAWRCLAGCYCCRRLFALGVAV